MYSGIHCAEIHIPFNDIQSYLNKAEDGDTALFEGNYYILLYISNSKYYCYIQKHIYYHIHYHIYYHIFRSYQYNI